MLRNRPKMGLAEQSSRAARLRAVRASGPDSRVMSRAARMISSRVNRTFGGIGVSPPLPVK